MTDHSYPAGQLARALQTASSHEDPATRARADDRAQAWLRVLDGTTSGHLDIGSRTPVGGLPIWVTLEVLRGGFATGRASAEGPLADDERQRAVRLRIEPTRRALFGSWLTDDGLAELGGLLEDGGYEIDQPENAALLVVAWLTAAGDRTSALELLDTVGPYADRLRFWPRVAPKRAASAGQIWRSTAADATEALLAQRTPPLISAEREALSVWLPLTDRFLALWWAPDGGCGEFERTWSTSERDIATDLVTAYEAATVQHRLCGKYRSSKENLPILVSLTRARLAGSLAEGQRRRARSTVDAMVAKRGAPRSRTLTELREAQERTAKASLHRDLSRVVAERCQSLPPRRGIDDLEAVLAPTSVAEADRHGVPVGSRMPASAARKVRISASGTPEDLIAAGLIPSAEVLAELVPALTAEQVATAYGDPQLGQVMAATYEAFRRRRSLLLLDLAKQAQFAEVPWVRAVEHLATAADPERPLEVARRMASLALDGYPGTILPNPLISELTSLFDAGRAALPLTEELAADIFMGRFSDKFRLAAQAAAAGLRNSLYSRYYDIDYDEILALPPTPRHRPVRRMLARWLDQPLAAEPTFGDLCQRGAPSAGRRSVARNGMVIERQQLITTHNLATLVFEGGVTPGRSWFDLAVLAAHRCADLLQRAQQVRRPLATVKDAAYAWRQALLFLTLAGEDRADELVAVVSSGAACPGPMRVVLDGLTDVVAGQRFDPEGCSPHGRRLLGWTIRHHWVLADRQ